MNSKTCKLCSKKVNGDYVCRTCKKTLCEDCATFCALCDRALCPYSKTDCNPFKHTCTTGCNAPCTWRHTCTMDCVPCGEHSRVSVHNGLICKACLEREASDPDMDDPEWWKPATDSEDEEEETEKL